MSTATLENLDPAKLRANPRNARTHSKKQIRLIADSIRRFGFTAPIVADENHVILAGHGRWDAARALGLRAVPVIVVNGLAEAERRAYLLADNKLAELAGWDRATLAVELNELGPLLSEAGLDLEITGFGASEIDFLLGELVDPEQEPPDEPPKLGGAAISRVGDLCSPRSGCSRVSI